MFYMCYCNFCSVTSALRFQLEFEIELDFMYIAYIIVVQVYRTYHGTSIILYNTI
jgi:hypothetical protein